MLKDELLKYLKILDRELKNLNLQGEIIFTGGAVMCLVHSARDMSNNLYSFSREEIQDYFKKKKIKWWKGNLTNNTMSSQVSCLNHLFSIRDDKDAVIAIVKHMYPEIVDVFKISTDHYAPAYIQFESVSDVDHLNEGKPNIGRNCTSIDALIYGVSKNGRKILILIEWENAETYSNVDKAIGVSGIERKKRYSDLINNSSQLIANSHYVYYFEPFYQLMRQTLWSEQMISNKVSETVKADDFIYIHVIPSGNLTLLNKTYPCSGQDMEATWRSCLKDQSKYIIGSPKDLLSQVNWGKYPDLRKYLDARYW